MNHIKTFIKDFNDKSEKEQNKIKDILLIKIRRGSCAAEAIYLHLALKQ